MKRDIIICILLLILAVLGSAVIYKVAKPDDVEKEQEIEMRIVINDESFDVELEDNKATEELIDMLPLEINMEELNGNEKYHYFEEKFTTKATNPKQIKTGDIMLYGNNCLVLFYDTFDTHYSYTKIGHIANVDNLKELVGNEDVVVRLEKSK